MCDVGKIRMMSESNPDYNDVDTDPESEPDHDDHKLNITLILWVCSHHSQSHFKGTASRKHANSAAVAAWSLGEITVEHLSKVGVNTC